LSRWRGTRRFGGAGLASAASRRGSGYGCTTASTLRRRPEPRWRTNKNTMKHRTIIRARPIRPSA